MRCLLVLLAVMLVTPSSAQALNLRKNPLGAVKSDFAKLHAQIAQSLKHATLQIGARGMKSQQMANGGCTQANGTMPNGTMPNGTMPNGTMPNGTMPNGGGTMPNGTMQNFGGTMPNGTMPNGSMPNGGGTMPNGSMPNGGGTMPNGTMQNCGGTTAQSAACQNKTNATLTSFLACQKVENPLAKTFASDTAIATAWTDYKQTECYTVMTKVASLWKDKCFKTTEQMNWGAVIQYGIMVKHFGEETDDNGDVCGVTFGRLGRFSECDSFNATQCASAPECKTATTELPDAEEAGSNAGGLEVDADAAKPGYVQPVCTSDMGVKLPKLCGGGKCFSSFVKKSQKKYPNWDLSTFKLLDDLCIQSSGSLCFPILLDVMSASAGNPFSSAEYMDNICGSGNSKALTCLKRIVGVGEASDKRDAKKALLDCAMEVKAATANVTLRKATFSATCWTPFRRGIIKQKTAELELKTMCKKNSAREYCAVKHYALHSASDGCYKKARQFPVTQEACTVSCQASLQTAIDGMGCCAGTTQETYAGATALKMADYPDVKWSEFGLTVSDDALTQIATTAPLEPDTNEELTTKALPGFLATAANCGVTGLNNTLRLRCARSTKKARKALRVKISWRKINTDPAFKAKVKAWLKADVSSNLGLTPEEIVNDVIEEDTTTTTAGRRFAEQADNSSNGIVYTFDIQADDESATDASSATFDELNASGEFTLTETNDGFVNCTDCTTTDGDLTEADNSTPVPEGGSASFSGATGAAILGALTVVAFTTMLALFSF